MQRTAVMAASFAHRLVRTKRRRIALGTVFAIVCFIGYGVQFRDVGHPLREHLREQRDHPRR